MSMSDQRRRSSKTLNEQRRSWSKEIAPQARAGSVVDSSVPLAISMGVDTWAEGAEMAEEFVWTVLEGGSPGPDEVCLMKVSKLAEMAKRTLGVEVTQEAVEKALHRVDFDSKTNTTIDFQKYYQFMQQVRDYAYEADEHAGFDRDQVLEFSEAFNAHLKSGETDLRTAQLFEVWRPMGMPLNTVEEQERMIEVIKDCDANRNGTTDIGEFLNIMRRVATTREMEEAEQDWALLRGCRYTEVEIEETKQMYKMFLEGDAQSGYKFTMISLKRLFEALDKKMNKEQFEQAQGFLASSESFKK